MHTNESIHRYYFRHAKALAKLASGSTTYQLKHRLACLYEKYSTRGHVWRQIQHLTLLRAIFVSQHAPSCYIFHRHAAVL